MARFTLPRDIYHGKGCLEELKNLKGKKAFLVVGGGSMKRQGFLDKAVHYLKDGGMEVEVFEGVEPDPSVETVMRGAEAMRKFEPDWIVSMGGGSPIDAAKAMWAFYEYPETTFEDLITPFSFPELRQKARFAAIPSTSGTATEVTAFSVITNYQTGVKYPLADFNITPDVAIVDPDGTSGETGCLYRYGCPDPCDRGVRLHIKRTVYGSAGTSGDRDGSGIPPGILQWKYPCERGDALRAVSRGNGILQCASWNRSLYGPQDGSCVLHRTYSARMRERDLSSVCHPV